MQSTRSLTTSSSSERPCKRRYTAKKTVTFSSKVKLRSFFASGHNILEGYSSWLTSDELSSMKKRAKNLSMIHQIKTRPGKPTPSDRSGIVYNCHPAHYEIIGESLRGMEHHTDISKARRRERLRSDAISLVEEHHNLQESSRSKLACMYKESSKEALVYSRQVANEDASIAAAILADDLKHDLDGVAQTQMAPSTLNNQGLSCLDLLLHCIQTPKVVYSPC